MENVYDERLRNQEKYMFEFLKDTINPPTAVNKNENISKLPHF